MASSPRGLLPLPGLLCLGEFPFHLAFDDLLLLPLRLSLGFLGFRLPLRLQIQISLFGHPFPEVPHHSFPDLDAPFPVQVQAFPGNGGRVRKAFRKLLDLIALGENRSQLVLAGEFGGKRHWEFQPDVELRLFKPLPLLSHDHPRHESFPFDSVISQGVGSLVGMKRLVLVDQDSFAMGESGRPQE
jgi:hypothetical protein